MENYVSSAIIKEECDKFKNCECCGLVNSTRLVLTKKGVGMMLSHLCEVCTDEISDYSKDYDYFVIKHK